MLKLTEGVAKTLLGMLKTFLQNLITKLSYLGIKGGLGELKRMMDSEEVGGTAAGRCEAGHQGARLQPRQGIKNAIRQAKLCVANDLCGNDGEGAGRVWLHRRKKWTLARKVVPVGLTCPARGIKNTARKRAAIEIALRLARPGPGVDQPER